MGCDNLISKESEGVGTNCLLKPVEGIFLYLLPQRVPPSVDANPSQWV